jgi:hypothetical protein
MEINRVKDPKYFLYLQKNLFSNVVMIFVCKLPINKIKGYLFSILSLSGPSSGSPDRVRQIMVLIKTVSKTKCSLSYINGAEYSNIELGFASFYNVASPRSILLYSAP